MPNTAFCNNLMFSQIDLFSSSWHSSNFGKRDAAAIGKCQPSVMREGRKHGKGEKRTEEKRREKKRSEEKRSDAMRCEEGGPRGQQEQGKFKWAMSCSKAPNFDQRRKSVKKEKK